VTYPTLSVICKTVLVDQSTYRFRVHCV